MRLYEGRIRGGQAPLMDEINRSLPVDIRLWAYDVATNRAWAAELQRMGIFSCEELDQMNLALDELAAMTPADFQPLPPDEDVHTLVERLLTERLGDLGSRIHTGRSRNDQVVCDLRLFAMDQLVVLQQSLCQAIACLVSQAEKHADTLMAGTTHLQPALPISLGHFLLSAGFALVRDLARLEDAYSRTDACPLGSGAMAGSGFPVDRLVLARDLGFSAVLPNSIDAVSDRDFCVEIAAACAMVAVHLSRYAEQFIIWANPAFGYVTFSDAWSTGSSMMPQKRNPDAMELIRGKCAGVMAASQQLMGMLKGVPLTYAKDLQEDKASLFKVLDETKLMMAVFGEAVASATFHPEALARALRPEMLATDLADALARVGVPFRKAHERVAQLVGQCEKEGRTLDSVTTEEMHELFPEFQGVTPTLDYRQSLVWRDVVGGTAPHRVTEQLSHLKGILAAKQSQPHSTEVQS